MNSKKSFAVCFYKGFHLTFLNGVTLSTQFGGGNYCENYNDDIDFQATVVEGKQSNDAEIAIWNRSGVWITREIMASLGEEINDDVIGYIGMERWLEIFDVCRKYKE